MTTREHRQHSSDESHTMNTVSRSAFSNFTNWVFLGNIESPIISVPKSDIYKMIWWFFLNGSFLHQTYSDVLSIEIPFVNSFEHPYGDVLSFKIRIEMYLIIFTFVSPVTSLSDFYIITFLFRIRKDIAWADIPLLKLKLTSSLSMQIHESVN